MEEDFPLIAVIGGSGFIGTRLCRVLEGREIAFGIFDKAPSAEFDHVTSRGDVRSIADLDRAIPVESVLINLAAEHRDDVRPVSLYDEVNVVGARNVCEIARRKDCRKIIFTSSVAVYGFAPIGTDESGKLNPFNEYGRTKAEAEAVYKAWQAEDPDNRTLVIIRPTVVFGEQNRGNVYNLLKLISSGWFFMLGNGKNMKSIAYVENVSAFIVHALTFSAGIHTYNYIDKPDFNMNDLVEKVYSALGRRPRIEIRIPYSLGYLCAKILDGIGLLVGKSLPISAIRVKKFCSNTVFDTSIDNTNFVAPVSIDAALERTIRYEFLESHPDQKLYFSE